MTESSDVTNPQSPGTDPLAPEPVGLSSLVRFSDNLDYEGWGRYVQIGATVVPDSQYETPTTAGFRVTDSMRPAVDGEGEIARRVACRYARDNTCCL